jgi:ABC-type transporter Mla MlaB component
MTRRECPVDFSITETREGYQLHGEMTFFTALTALKLAAPCLRQPKTRFDLSGVLKADSAGVGLLVEWKRIAMQAGCELRYAGVPESLRAMIRVGGIQGLLPIEGED